MTELSHPHSLEDRNGPSDLTKQAAELVALVYVNDGEPGIRRRGAGRGFSYVDSRGRRIDHDEVLARIRALAIPPAWTNVWICEDPEGHIQATGRDHKGRKQYRYHARWAACRDEAKYGSLVDFARALPRLRAAIDTDLRRRTLSFECVAAAVVRLLDKTMIRVGNSSYTRDNGSFGLTTLRDRHVEIEGASLRFAFKGKSGKEWRLRLSDRRIARVVKGAQDIPGQHLFQYFDGDGARRRIRSDDINAYIREATGSPFTSKHFRTWGGSVLAAEVLAATELPETQAGQRRALNEAVDQVASHLGNTRAVCRNCYVHPALIEDWIAGGLAASLTAARRSFRKLPSGLSESEMTLLRWLERRPA
ncbi:DNA topoisomerase IB [Mesorhizobium australicum]|uniref:DNA topoisomerase n=1 Tax=Mesorhizobium australicum TaxID=536018 RepID=A0A1X7P9K5_9HYPH|nr:DNA topoisomerase IB [Mesorhizobium australicum]SMH47777.1 DNA topoisomerase-1 [Mesorhizobium australicum]